MEVRFLSRPPCLALAALLLVAACAPGRREPVRVERFDKDPGWEGVNNKVVPTDAPTVTQNFGYDAGARRIGGTISRSSAPASYGQVIPERTLETPLSASSTVRLEAAEASSGLFVGWFNSRHAGAGRPLHSLGWYLDAEREGGLVMVVAVTARNRQHGDFVTPVEGGVKKRPIKPDGQPHDWELTYDPAGTGTMRFRLDGGAPAAIALPEGFKAEGASFDRFGVANIRKGGGTLKFALTDLRRDGGAVELRRDPGWEGAGNRERFRDPEQRGAHYFGYCLSSFAGGRPGEMGGTIWRVEEPAARCADRVGPLTMEDRLEASGKIVLTAGAPDSAVLLGWFEADGPGFVGAMIEGPSRVGHYFRPYATVGSVKLDSERGPVLPPDARGLPWSIAWDPAAGVLTASLDGESAKLEVPGKLRPGGPRLDRFGMRSVRVGGGFMKLYVDDLTYTAATR